jgi:hypothetical protein
MFFRLAKLVQDLEGKCVEIEKDYARRDALESRKLMKVNEYIKQTQNLHQSHYQTNLILQFLLPQLMLDDQCPPYSLPQ